MPADTAEKTEAPTTRRIQESREKGQVAKSPDLSAAIGLLTGMILLNIYGPRIMTGFRSLLQQSLRLDRVPLEPDTIIEHATAMVTSNAWRMLAPFFLVLLIAAIVVNLFQVGFILSTTPITPTFEKISILKGIQRLFSARTAMRMVMSLGKVAIITTVAFFTIKAYIPAIINVGDVSFIEVFGIGADLMFKLGLRIAVILLILAIIDYAYQKYKHTQDLRMTKEEVKEEMKRMEGDPIVRQRRRAVARQLAAQRMGQAVPKADVVITNPTHLAIALKYDHAADPAPKVVARGADFMAKRIREIANENGVPIVERKPLAQALYKSCQVGDYVPPELYKAVAEVLAYIFELAGKGFRRTAAS